MRWLLCQGYEFNEVSRTLYEVCNNHKWWREKLWSLDFFCWNYERVFVPAAFLQQTTDKRKMGQKDAKKNAKPLDVDIKAALAKKSRVDPNCDLCFGTGKISSQTARGGIQVADCSCVENSREKAKAHGIR